MSYDALIAQSERRRDFARLSQMVELCKKYNLEWEAGEFGLRVGNKTYPLKSVLKAELDIVALGLKRKNKITGWF